MSEFSELIKHLNRVRRYVRGFYLYDWRGRADYGERSSRTYDNEQRRVKSIFKKYVRSKFVRSKSANKREKKTSIMINATDIDRNPLFEVWRAKKFSKSDILLHFVILDEGAKRCCNGFTMRNVEKRITDILSMENFIWNDDDPSEATIRDKLTECEEVGLIFMKQEGRENKYFLSPATVENINGNLRHAIDFFSETTPFGEAGDHIKDEGEWSNRLFRFKHHFIAHTLDDEVLYDLLRAINERRSVFLIMENESYSMRCVPCKILVSVQTGRRYVGIEELDDDNKVFSARRLDYIDYVVKGNVIEETEFNTIIREFEEKLKNAWGVSFGISEKPEKPEKILMKLYINEQYETFVLDRLKREGRRGIIKRIEENIFSYSNEVWDTNEMMPFILSFIGRIISVECGEPTQSRFHKELSRMISKYGIGG